jgi:hypothetical protein
VTARRQRPGEATERVEGSTGSAGTAGRVGSRSHSRRLRIAASGTAAVAFLLGAAGCAKMDAALSKQWIVVDFNPGTSVATALHVRQACGHIGDTPAMALPPGKPSVLNTMYGVRYDTTNSSPAQLAELQTCLQKFKSVEGMDPEDAGDEGS